MLLTSRMESAPKDQRGQAVVTLALWLTGAFFALMVVGIDVGHLGTSATEVQTVADIAASAGARNLLKGGSANSAKTEAASVVAKNKVDGQGFTIAAADVHVGTYVNGVFTETSINPSAVRATPTATVNNVVAGLLGFKTATVQKEAIATFQGISQARPTLPIVIGECMFPGIDQCFNDPACMLKFDNFPKDNEPRSTWTGFNAGVGTSDITKWYPTVCGGSGAQVPLYSVGDTVSVISGTHNGATSGLQCLYNKGLRQFLIAVVDCNGNQLKSTIAGFATIVLDNTGVDFHVIHVETDGPLGGCAKCGSGKMALVK